MILAAGRGLRMRPLTDHTPKPLLEVRGKALIDYHLEALAAAGLEGVVINLHHLGERIRAHVGDGSRYGLIVQYSVEPQLLETAGGIAHALDLLDGPSFLVVSADIFTGFDLTGLPSLSGQSAHLVMVPNPPHHERGDFALADDGRLALEGPERLTYANIGIYSRTLFEDLAPSPLRLRVLLDREIAAGRMTGEIFTGCWSDVGTPERLEALNR